MLSSYLSLDPAPPSAKAVNALAGYLGGGDGASKLEEVRDLVLEFEGEGDEESKEEEKVVRVVAGTMFILEKENEEAVATLTEGVANSDLEWSVHSSYTAESHQPPVRKEDR